MSRPLLLDLFCCAGGAAEGYHRAGFDVVGVDINPQPNYPFRFIQADALTLATDPAFVVDFDAIHASRPCPRYSTVTPTHARGKHPDLVAATRDALVATGLPYVIENVPKSPLIDPVVYCGSSFGLDVRRHRLFEASFALAAPPCDHGWQTPRFRSLASQQVKEGRLASVVGVHGNINYAGEFELRCKAMGIDWMTNAELTQAIPPAFTEHIGRQLAEQLAPTAVAA